jgi:hypothetical protein
LRAALDRVQAGSAWRSGSRLRPGHAGRPKRRAPEAAAMRIGAACCGADAGEGGLPARGRIVRSWRAWSLDAACHASANCSIGQGRRAVTAMAGPGPGEGRAADAVGGKRVGLALKVIVPTGIRIMVRANCLPTAACATRRRTGRNALCHGPDIGVGGAAACPDISGVF